jgi:hypothetical protein
MRTPSRWKCTVVLGVVLLACPLVAAAQGAASNPCLQSLRGRWSGMGTVSNRPIWMVQTWGPAMQGTFTELRMTHHVAADTTRVVFEGRGFYASAGTDSVMGTWFDARGISMPLRGSCTGMTLTMQWLGDRERGRTAYGLHGADSLSVLDEVAMPDGSFRAFGRSMLKRAR